MKKKLFAKTKPNGKSNVVFMYLQITLMFGSMAES